MKRKGFLITITTALSLFYAASAFSVDTLPFYAASGSTPNVLIVLDRSGSMNETPAGGSGTYCPTNPWGTGCTNESKLSIAVRVLADLLDANDTKTVDNTDDPKALGVRLGYMKFYGSTIGTILPDRTGEGTSPVYYNGGILIPEEGGNRLDVGASYVDIFSNFNTSATSSIGTPDGIALSEALKYFQNASKITGDACYSTTCRRKNYVILVTDGEDNETCASGVGASNNRSIVYAAKALYDEKIPVFVVGFGALPDSGKYTLNWAAYYGNGVNLDSSRDPNPETNDDTGSFTPGSSLCDSTVTTDPGAQKKLGYAFLASDAASLTTALKKAIDLTKEGSYTRSQPVLTASGNRIYSSFFDLGNNVNWQGHLDAWNVDSAGVIQDSAINDPCTSSASTPVTGALRELYDAGRTLTYSSCTGNVLSANRNIYTAIGTSRIDFKTASGTPTPNQISLCTALIKTTGSCTSAETIDTAVGSSNELINFIRFSSATYNSGPGTRSSTWRLGDIWHSTPTIVGPPVGSYGSAAYNTFKSNNSSRTQALIVGANDGMLHAFNDGNYGAEMWSFIPNNLLGKLKNLNTGHDFYVDASPTAADVCLNTTNCGKSAEAAADWKTVVITGERDGGRGYFALDITSATNPLYLWQFTDANLGYTSSKPAIGKVRVKSGGNYEDHWVTFFGGGTSTDITTGIGNSFYAVDIGTGTTFGSGATSTKYAIGTAANKVPGAPMAVDINGDFYVDAVFFGDTDGRFWKLKTTDTTPTNSNWPADKIFDPALAHKTISCPAGTVTTHSTGFNGLRPIYYRPAVVFDSNLKPLLMFGTGYVDDNTEPGSTVQNYFYIVRLESLAYSGIASPNEYITEILSLALNAGETVVGAPVVYDGMVWYVTYTPSSTSTCCGSGTAKLRWAELKTCGATGVVDLGSGIPQGPVIGPNGIYTNTSNSPKPTKCTTCPTGPGNLSDVIYWRER